ncbi:MAG: tetratricopeptide repeat protein [bacterium]|nr:tetratricopeptide repeat protein [bacterium]
MPRGFLSRAKTYTKNLGKHAKRIARGRESASEALGVIAKDTRRLKDSVGAKRPTSDSKAAARQVEEGRQHYNQKRYAQAEEVLRDAILTDANSGLAYTYLGYTLYKQGRLTEAATYWNKAIEVDPNSEAAEKASRKLRVLESKKKKVNEWLDDRLG